MKKVLAVATAYAMCTGCIDINFETEEPNNNPEVCSERVVDIYIGPYPMRDRGSVTVKLLDAVSSFCIENV